MFRSFMPENNTVTVGRIILIVRSPIFAVPRLSERLKQAKVAHLVWDRGVMEDTTYLMNITEKNVLDLKCELTPKYSARKSQHC